MKIGENTTRFHSCLRQLMGAFEHFAKEELECCITLAAAAEGMLPPTDEPHLWKTIRDTGAYGQRDFNRHINWLKHHRCDDNETYISKMSAFFILLRAHSKFVAVYQDEFKDDEDFRLLKDWPRRPGVREGLTALAKITIDGLHELLDEASDAKATDLTEKVEPEIGAG